jgi:hypothetical protein
VTEAPRTRRPLYKHTRSFFSSSFELSNTFFDTHPFEYPPLLPLFHSPASLFPSLSSTRRPCSLPNATVHLRIHYRRSPILCEMCNSSFTRQADLRRHVRQTHSKKRNHRCGVCSCQFTQGTALARYPPFPGLTSSG